MSKKNEFNASEKLVIVQELELGEDSRAGVARKHNISVTTLVKWRHQYEMYGFGGLEIRTHNNSYSADGCSDEGRTEKVHEIKGPYFRYAS